MTIDQAITLAFSGFVGDNDWYAMMQAQFHMAAHINLPAASSWYDAHARGGTDRMINRITAEFTGSEVPR